ncbi:hypothetical protein AB4Z48_03050 [Cupriavidus sp. 2TAF22]|uniref:hypothetical protein n=1 Tax=unclassified Cupriavidus TaxID=2640874 RepID=UPI003F933893
MLNAVLNGKKRGTGLEGITLRLGEAEGAEDVLTATVFERLSYLPDTVLVAFFSHLLSLDLPPLDEIAFWPWWRLNGTGVEPDVLLTCGTRRVLVEAKRHDFLEQQYADQLARELLAGWESDELGEENVTLLTIGGMMEYSPVQEKALKGQIITALNRDASAAVPQFELICRSWGDVYQSLGQVVRNSQGYGNGLQRIIDDIGSAFAWHGIRTHPPRWLTDLRHYHITSVSFHYFSPMASLVATRSALTPLVTLAPAHISAEGKSFDMWRFYQ